MHSHCLLLLILPLVLAAPLPAPLPQFAGIGPWEGEFFGRDPRQSRGPARAAPYNPHALPPPPYGPPAYYGVPNSYGAQPVPPYLYEPPQSYPGLYDPYTSPAYYSPAPPLFPNAPNTDPFEKYHVIGVDPTAGQGDFMQPPPPPPPPIDLMNASKEELAAALPPPPAPKPKASEKPASEAKGPAEGEGRPEKKKGEKKKGEEKEEEKEKAPRPFDFMGGRWGIAGQGALIDAARGDHKYKHSSEREDRRNRWGGEKTAAEKQAAKEEEEEEEEEEEVKQAMPEVTVEHAADPEHPLKYKVNVGGIKTGPDDETGPSNFHVFTNEGTKKYSGDDMSPETQKYIIEKMLPKIGGRRRKGGNSGGNVFSVFGDD
ncbi:hypothetical protein BZA05DRAFT_452612 [Tricharina praecox]|uniref:uncharacterized protein n=1 Tax=Tricharina praecox TaxID=43433 RepID=UPI00221E9D5E|nr:uncharacterized protein BZA05DRAFT_452612 [Tricharina praecox]KAI5852376.1 hypothetical protein BZA05DRAFT_452612 [Tricharina praecox]